MTDDPFDEGVPRNGRGNPLIIPCKRGKPDLKAKLVPYVRASTFCSALDNGGGLATWRTRHAAVGLACRPDLAAMVAALGRNVNDYDRADKQALDSYIEAAHDTSGGNDKANYGTAVHTLTEPGRDPFAVDERMVRDVAAYDDLITDLGLAVTSTEVFVVNDELGVAGTFDHAYELVRPLVFANGDENDDVIPAGTVLLGDKKTGTLHLDQHAIQLAVYARGKTYDHHTGERAPLDVSPQWGLAVHIPRGEARAVAYLVDLHAGYAAAKLAKAVREYTSAANVKTLGRVVAEAVAPVAVQYDDPSPSALAAGVHRGVPSEQYVEAVAEVPCITTLDEQRGTVTFRDDNGNEQTVERGYIDEPKDAGDAITNLHAAGLIDTSTSADPIMRGIAAARTPDELHNVWRANKTADWTPGSPYTVAAKVKAEKLRKSA